MPACIFCGCSRGCASGGRVAVPDTLAPRRRMLPLASVKRTYADRVLAVGDAAGLVKPTTGGGIYYSVVSGEIAADVLGTQLAANDLSAAALREYERRLARALSIRVHRAAGAALRRPAHARRRHRRAVHAGDHRRHPAARATNRAIQPASRFHPRAAEASAGPARAVRPSRQFDVVARRQAVAITHSLGEDSTTGSPRRWRAAARSTGLPTHRRRRRERTGSSRNIDGGAITIQLPDAIDQTQ